MPRRRQAKKKLGRFRPTRMLRRYERERRFRQALKLAGTTAGEWAERHDITAGHLSQVLSGKRDSTVLWDAINFYTDEQLRRARERQRAVE